VIIDPGRNAIPCFINPEAGTATAAARVVGADSRLDVRECNPSSLLDMLRREVEAGTRRIVVAGGDGTIAAAAGVLAATGVELAVIPAGTLNHFAARHGIPVDPKEAVELAVNGSAGPVDVGYVNERLFLNTSSAGVYVAFVLTRERYERYVGYYLASMLASLRTLAHLHTYRVRLEIDAVKHTYASPLVFVGIGERDVRFPAFGDPVPDGTSALHVMVASGKRRLRLVALGLTATARGLRAVARTPNLDAFLVDKCEVSLRGKRVRVSIDGELVRLRQPLRYRIERECLEVVMHEGSGRGASSGSKAQASSSA
jgi:diacylglycerol kinase family enzyme